MTDKMRELTSRLVGTVELAHLYGCSRDACGAPAGLRCDESKIIEEIQAERERSSSRAGKIVLSGDTGGGRRELIVSVNGKRVGRMDYEQCGWSFREHAEIFTKLGTALGIPVLDETR